MLRCFLWLLKFEIWKFSQSTLLIFVGDVAVISWNSRSQEKWSSLKWQLSYTHSWERKFFEMTNFIYPFMRKEVLWNDNFRIHILEKGSSLKWQLSHTHSFIVNAPSFCSIYTLTSWNLFVLSCYIGHRQTIVSGQILVWVAGYHRIDQSKVCFNVPLQYQSACSRAVVVIENEFWRFSDGSSLHKWRCFFSNDGSRLLFYLRICIKK